MYQIGFSGLNMHRIVAIHLVWQTKDHGSRDNFGMTTALHMIKICPPCTRHILVLNFYFFVYDTVTIKDVLARINLIFARISYFDYVLKGSSYGSYH